MNKKVKNLGLVVSIKKKRKEKHMNPGEECGSG